MTSDREHGRPRLLHLFNAFQVGGAERQHFLLVKYLAPHFDQICWAYNHGQLEEELSSLGVEILCGDFETVAPTIRRGGLDCVVMRTHRYFREFMDLFSRGDVPLIYIKDYLKWFEGNGAYLDSEFDSLILRVAAKTFFCGPLLKDGAIAMGACPVDHGVLFNGLETKLFPMQPRLASSRTRPLRIGILGNLIPRKNQLAAVEVLSPLLEKEEYELVLGGDDHDKKYAERLERESRGLNVRLAGFVSDIPAFMASIDVLLSTSLQEGWPVSILEAMACGVPVIAPAIGDIPELLDHGRCGLLYPEGEYGRLPGLMAVLEDAVTYSRFSEAGVDRVRSFDVGKSAVELERAIFSLLEGRSVFPEVEGV